MKKKSYLFTKIFISLLPALILLQNYAWMAVNRYAGYAFLIIWGFIIWRVSKLESKNEILERLFRYSEIGAFLLPISAIIFTFVIGAESINMGANEFEQAGAAIGTAIGGFFVVGLAFVIGLFGGFIFHLIGNRYEKKAEKGKNK